MQQMNETDEGKERREHGAGMSSDGAGTDGAGRSDERRCRAAYRAQAKEMKRRIYPNGIDILAMIGIILVSSLAAGLVGGALTWLTEWNTGLVNALTYFLQMGLAITFILVQRRTRQAPTNVLNMHAGRISAPLILWGIVLIFVTGVVIEPLLELSGQISRTAQPIYRYGRLVHSDDGRPGTGHGGDAFPGPHTGFHQ